MLAINILGTIVHTLQLTEKIVIISTLQIIIHFLIKIIKVQCNNRFVEGTFLPGDWPTCIETTCAKSLCFN